MVDFDTMWHRLFDLAGAKTNIELGRFLGLTPQAVSKAKKKREIPYTWLATIREKTGRTWEELYAPVTPAVSQVAVANGHGNHVANAAQTPPPPPPGDDITNNLCQLIRDRMAGLDMDQQIELRARVKRALEER